MAKGKKKEELSLEEKLEQALVPVEEWPYEVPGNWCWTRWGMIGEFIAGNGFKKEYQGFTGYEIPFYKVGSLKYADDFGYLYDESNTITEEMCRSLKAVLIPPNSILFAKIGEAIRLNRRCLNKKECCIDNNTMAFLTHSCNFRYVYYWTLGQKFYDLTNATTVPAIRKSDLELIRIPLPPLQEQQRIVERIDSLFAKLDEVSEKTREILDGFEERKAAILHRAFSGKLTEAWRKENKCFKEWKTTIIRECCKMGSGGTPSRKCLEYYQGSIPWIKTGEINWNKIYSAEECISEIGVKNSSAKIYEEGAILVAMYGMGVTRGRAAILKTKAATNQAVCVLVPCKDILNYYLFYYFMCNYWDIREKAVGGNQLNLSATIIGAFEIEIPPMEEQKEIVRLLDGLLEKEEQCKENAEIVLDYIDMIKKAILARAFRGELGTNEPEEESAIELLKVILKES